MEINSYDHIIVSFSGGKDSVACFLNLIESGADLNKVELWHNNVDGAYHQRHYFDWPCTEMYVRRFARAFSVPVYFSWRDGGLNREMHRNEQTTAGVKFEQPGRSARKGSVALVTLKPSSRAKETTRRMFPQVTANLSQRWCSAYGKIDVARRALNNQERFIGKRILFITGERAQESSARAKYEVFEDHMTNSGKKTVHAWRPIHQWKEEKVWDLYRLYNVLPHPAYRLGFGRVSCLNCIFSSADQIASIRALNPERFEWVCQKEEEFGKTIHRKYSWRELVEKGTPYPAIAEKPWLAKISQSKEYHEVINTIGEWELPAGAFGESTGPT